MQTKDKTRRVALGRYAAFDIGTVTCRMMVADVGEGSDGAIRVDKIAKERAMVNLGEGVDATRRLNPDAIARTIAAIDDFLSVRDALDLPDHPVLGTAVMATSASRDAENALEFAELLSKRGLSLSIIPGEKEAALSFEGATMDCVGAPVAVVDAGGGSTEISIGIGGGEPFISHSFNIGCRRMTERFLDGYPPASESVEAARRWAREDFEAWLGSVDPAIKRFLDGCGISSRKDGLSMIAVAGTATSAVSMREKMEVYDPSRVHGSAVSAKDLQGLVERISRMTLPEIEGMAGLDPRRAPVILAGIVILQEAMRSLAVDEFVASESDILQGMIMYMAKSQHK